MRFYFRVTFFIVLFSASFTVAVAQPCEDGFSGPYPCSQVDQHSFMNLQELLGISSNDIWGWTSSETGREYALVGLFDKTAFIDVTSPAHPLYIGYLPTATFGILWRDIKVIDHYAYIVAEAAGHGIQVFDLKRLESNAYANTPVIFDADANYTGFGNAHNIVADTANKYVYAVGSDTFAGGLHVVDVSDPLNPVYAGGSEEDGYTHDAQVVNYTGPDPLYQGRQICFAANENTITIFDVTDKNLIEMISRTGYEDVGYTHQCWVTEDMRYLIANDELDEINFGINTRTIIFDIHDLQNPVVAGYVDLGTPSIDHNLYVHDGLVYESNYTSGVRIFSLIDVEDGDLVPVGFFDVIPEHNNVQFAGSWSNYPYFDSGTVVATNMYQGLHVLRPRLFAARETVTEVCGANTATLIFDINVPIASTVSYGLEYTSGSGPSFFFENSSTPGAPAVNGILFTGLSSFSGQNVTGNILVSYDDTVRKIPFVLAVGSDLTPPAEPLAPLDGEVLPDQLVEFSWSGAEGYAVLEVAVDPEFENIVYAEEIFGAAGVHAAHMPFDETFYYWRISRPDACYGGTVVSNLATFEIGITASVRQQPADDHRLKVFPNPASEYVMVEVPKGEEHIVFYDLTGRKTAERKVSAEGLQMHDLSEFSPGVYIVSGVKTGRFTRFVVK